MANRIVLNTVSYHGKGAIGNIVPELTARGFQKAFVCSDPDLIRFNVTKKVTDLLDAAGFAYEVYSDIKPNPTIENVQTGVAAFRKSGADCIVAIGGGSSMDTAKAIGVIIENPEFADVRSLEGVAPTKKHAVFTIAVPTTAGTAAEVTINYVITDVEKKRKFVCVDTNDIPEVAVIDPDMMASMPKGLTAATGMDALTHAIEAYVSTLHCNYTDPLALHAIKLIHENLKKSYDGDMAARDTMHDAQCLAGMAFSNALLGIVHSMAHKTGAAYSGGHIIHGAANAMYLPKVIKFNARNAEAAGRYAEIARFIDLPGSTTEELVDALIAELRKMNKELNIPYAIQNYGEGGVIAEQSIIDEKEFNEKLSEVAKNAIADACTGSNPRIPTQEEMEKLLTAVYYDKEIDF